MIAFKKFYHCKRTVSDGVATYQVPILKWGNYQALSGYVDTLKYGESIGQKWRLQIAAKGNESEYSVGDLLYFDGCEPDYSNQYINGTGANGVITAVNPGYKSIQIEIEKIIEGI